MKCDSPNVQLNTIRVYFESAFGHGLPKSSDVPLNRQDCLKLHCFCAKAVKSVLILW